MSQDAPDGKYAAYTNAGNISDVGEVGERLLMGGGSTSRTGRIQWATGFENGLVATDFSYLTTVGVIAGSSGLYAWQGNNCLNLTTTGANNATAYMSKFFPASLQTGRWGIEAMINFAAVYNSQVDIWMNAGGAPSPNPSLTAIIRLLFGASNASATLQYQDVNGVFQTLATLNSILSINLNVYYYVKLVADFNLGTYQRFYLNNRYYDFTSTPLLATSAMQKTNSASSEYSSFQIKVTANEALAKAIGVDNVILTSDEP